MAEDGWFGKLVCPLFFVLLSTVHSRDVETRLEDLEILVNRNSLQMRLDIRGIRKQIQSLNGTGTTAISTGSRTSDVSYKEYQNLVETVETFMVDQTIRTEALKIAFIEEKASKKTSKTQETVKVQVDNEYKTELNKSITDLYNQLRQEATDRQTSDQELRVKMTGLKTEFQRNMDGLETEFQRKIDDLESLVSECQRKMETLEDAIQYVSPGSKTKIGPPCPPAWLEHEDKCYLFVTNETVRWEVANLLCHGYRSILAEPETKEAVLYLLSKSGGRAFWIGVTDEDEEGVWRFATSKREMTFFEWAFDQPNNYGGSQSYIELTGRVMNDEHGAEPNNFVCEMNRNTH